MANTRMISTKFWSDTWIADLDPIEKLLFLYLITNERTNLSGIYELPIKHMATETGIEKEMIEKILRRFEKDTKVFYVDGWIFVKNFQKHQDSTNEKIKKGIDTLMTKIPPQILEKLYAIDTLSIDHTYPLVYNNNNNNKNKNNNDKEISEQISAIHSSYQEKIQKKAMLTSGARDKIKTRLKIFSLEDLLLAVDKFSKSSWWMENNRTRGMAWFFHSDDRIEQFINLEVEKQAGLTIL